MKIYGFMIVKNECDILAQTIESLLTYGGFTKIFIFDNMSDDNTFAVAKKYESDVVKASQLNTPFSDNLKFENVYRHAALFNEGDWFAILDADEIYAEALYPICERATKEGANLIETKSAQFYFTEKDDSYDFDSSEPAHMQRPFYLVNYGEPRVFKYAKSVTLSADYVKSRPNELIAAKHLFQIFHFQFRSSKQMQKRIQVRIKNDKHSGNWGHVNATDWREYIVKSTYLHKYNGTIELGLPKQASLYKIPDNAAYTMANILWLKKHDFLSVEQRGFLKASRLKRIFKRLF
ncbi:glycosyltransferase family 2 protein [Alteromonas gracilis]|uniref:glycosyltransferase family 2 protein n=1 Tax=Alteromonas gracilis TaxID=1479524 RepID=UPI002FE1D48F